MTMLSERLEAARALIAQGWSKGSFTAIDPSDRSSSYCIRGALNKVFFDDPASCHEFCDPDLGSALALLGEAVTPGKVESLIVSAIRLSDWNDAPTTKHEHVLAAFDRAIAEAKRLEAEADKLLAELFNHWPGADRSQRAGHRGALHRHP